MTTKALANIRWSGRQIDWSEARRIVARPVVPVAFLAAIAGLLPLVASSGLAVTGDGALHTDLASQVAGSFSLSTEPVSHYPPLFHIVGGAFYSVADIAGLRLVSALSLAVVSLMAYLIGRQLGMGFGPSLVAQALISFSPVMVWYAGLILMETALVASVMTTVWLALRFHDRPHLRRGVVLVLSLVAMLLIKQTAAPVAVGVILFLGISRSVGVRRSGVVAAVTLLAIALPYWRIYDSTGALIDLGQPSLTEVEESSSGFPGTLISGGWVERQSEWSLAIEQDVDSAELYRRGTRIHEQRRVWIGNILSWGNFTGIHSPYPAAFNGYDYGQTWPTTLFFSIGLALGVVAIVAAARRQFGWTLIGLVFLASYFAMYFGSDTKRLYLFVTALSVLVVILGYVTAWKWTVQQSRLRSFPTKHGVAVTAGLAALFLVFALPQLRSQFQALDERETTQGGGFASVGGVESIVEIAEWIKSNSQPDQGFVAASVYEWEYYSDRQDLWDEGLDYRLYFMSPELIHHYLDQADARYVVIRTNQIVPDDEWNHIELVPQQFVTAIEEMFPVVHESISADIRVYEVTALEASAT